VPVVPAFGWAFAQVLLTLDDDAVQVARAELSVGAEVVLRLNAVEP
jgi:hypothetical protein